MKILFVTPHFPWPPLSREQVRAYNQIKHLSEAHSVTLLSLTPKDNVTRYRLELEKLGVRTVVVKMNRFRASVHLAARLFSSDPFQISYFSDRALWQKLAWLVEEGEYDLAHFQLARMLPYATSIRDIPTVVDFMDAPTLDMSRRYRYREFWMKPLISIERSRLAGYEVATGSDFTRAIVSSQIDKDSMRVKAPVSVNPSGVDLQAFPYVEQRRQQSTIIFSGNMADMANIDAVMSFYRNTFPRIIKKKQNVRLYIVGANPPYYIRRLSKDERVIVTGLVPDVHRYQEASTISVCPSSMGAGIQNKVLEAMASGTPVVAAREAVAGMEVIAGRHLLVADSSMDFAEQVLDLLDNEPLQRRLSAEARQLVETKYTWEASVRQLEYIYEETLSCRSEGEHQHARSAKMAR